MDRVWKTVFEPFKIAAVEPLPSVTRAERETALRAAGGDPARVPADLVPIDLSDDADGAAWCAAPAAGTRGVAAFEEAVRGLTGMRHLLPVHAGRAAERILFRAAAAAGRTILSNGLGATARANAEALGAKVVEAPALESLDPTSDLPFKGDADAFALEARIRELGPGRVAMIVLTLAGESLGGQAVSMGGLRAAREVARARGIPLFLDAARFAENSWLVRTREHGYARRAAAEIARETFSCADGCWMSGSRDASSPAGGFLALNDGRLAEACRAEAALSEGEPAPRDLEALAAGLTAALDERALSYRARSIERLAEGLRAAGVPIFEPPGGHAVMLDARRLLPHLSAEDRPARALACELYLTAGVRGAEAGAAAAFVSLSVPRRTYTRAHLDLALEAVADVASRAAEIGPLRRSAVEAAA